MRKGEICIMKNDNLKKVKDKLFIGFVFLMAILVIGTITIVARKNAAEYENIVMTETKDIKFVNPLKNVEVVKDYSQTKLQFNSTLKQWEAHKAVDLKGNVGDEVLAVSGGKVVSVETSHLLGTTVTIEHASGFKTVYASLNEKVNVKARDTVESGEVIGTLDNTAKGELEEGVHLHFELLKDGKKVDPNLYFTFGQK